MVWTVGKKLYTGFFIVILLMGILGWAGISKLGQLNEAARFIGKDKTPALYTVQEMKYILSQNFSLISEHIISPNEETMLKKEDQYAQNTETLDQLFQNYQAYITSDEEKKMITDLQNNLQTYDTFVDNIFGLSRSNRDEQAKKDIAAYQDKMDAMKSEMNDLVAYNMKMVDKANQYTNGVYEKGRTQSILFVVIAALLAAGIAYFITKGISKPLNAVTNRLSRIADGDLTMNELSVRNQDEMGTLVRSLNHMTEDLNGALSTTGSSALQVASASEQLSASAVQNKEATEQLLELVQSSSEGTETQLEKINQVSASLDHMVVQIKNINSSSTEMDQSVANATDYAQAGTESIEQVVGRIHDIETSFDHVNAAIHSLNGMSKEIGQMLTLITSISEQTNLLALNAAIEASRAGEHGKGFAVVADEVRKLAEESKQSAGQIVDMIAHIQTETGQAVTAIEEGNAKVQEGIASTDQASEAFSHIEQAISEASGKVSDVAVSIKDIENISTHIAQALDNVRSIAEESVHSTQNSTEAAEEQLASMEEISLSATSLSELAEHMQHAAAKFKVRSEHSLNT